MRFIPIIFTATLLLSGGCDSGSKVIIAEPTTNQPTTNTPESIQAMFAGATFVGVEQAGSTDNPNSGMGSGTSLVRFTADNVSWSRENDIRLGSYSLTGDTDLVATFPNSQVTFSADSGNLIWDSVSHRRAASSLFSSQESLTTYLDGSRYDSVEKYDVGETPDGSLALGNWSVRFYGDEIHWAVQDTIAVGSYSYLDESSFKAVFSNQEFIVVVLDNMELVLNSIVYEENFSNQFTSQETLVAFLDGVSYKSVDLQNNGGPIEGTVALGYWQINFDDGMFTWFYQDIAQVGSVTYVNNSTFKADFSGRENTVTVEGDDIIWDGIRYRKVPAE